MAKTLLLFRRFRYIGGVRFSYVVIYEYSVKVDNLPLSRIYVSGFSRFNAVIVTIMESNLCNGFMCWYVW